MRWTSSRGSGRTSSVTKPDFATRPSQRKLVYPRPPPVSQDYANLYRFGELAGPAPLLVYIGGQVSVQTHAERFHSEPHAVVDELKVALQGQPVRRLNFLVMPSPPCRRPGPSPVPELAKVHRPTVEARRAFLTQFYRRPRRALSASAFPALPAPLPALGVRVGRGFTASDFPGSHFGRATARARGRRAHPAERLATTTRCPR